MHQDIDANREFLGDVLCMSDRLTRMILLMLPKYAVNNPERMAEFVSVNYAKLLEKYTWDKVAVKYVEYLRSIGGE